MRCDLAAQVLVKWSATPVPKEAVGSLGHSKELGTGSALALSGSV